MNEENRFQPKLLIIHYSFCIFFALLFKKQYSPMGEYDSNFTDCFSCYFEFIAEK